MAELPDKALFLKSRSFPPPRLPSGPHTQSFLCVFCTEILADPLQASCGDRACSSCVGVVKEKFQLYKPREKLFNCPSCHTQLSPSDFFPDKAALRELWSVLVTCPNSGCLWRGNYEEYHPGHLTKCTSAPVSCPHCGQSIPKKKVQNHKRTCPNRPLTCQHCNTQVLASDMEVHMTECELYPISCESCGKPSIARKLMALHLSEKCPKVTRACFYSTLGCPSQGTAEEMTLHETESVAIHLKMVVMTITDIGNQVSRAATGGINLAQVNEAIIRLEDRTTQLTRQLGDVMAEVQQQKSTAQARSSTTEEAITMLQQSVKELQGYYTDLALSVQTLQATSYSGIYIWKVPELTRRKRDAVLGKTISLYSAPFFTSRHGYKLCLRVYLNGDGSGRGTHLSFFITLMKGEFDPLLPWPFKQTVSLSLLAQDGVSRDITQSFKPDEESSSFQMPKSEMNVASGCPQFCSLAVLENPSYARADTIYLKGAINILGLEHIP